MFSVHWPHAGVMTSWWYLHNRRKHECYNCNMLQLSQLSLTVWILQISRTQRLWRWGISPWTAQASTGAQRAMTWEKKTAPLRSQCSVSFGERRGSRPRSVHLTPNCHSDWWLLFQTAAGNTFIPLSAIVYLPILPQCSKTVGTAPNLNWSLLVTTYAPTVMFHCHTNTFPEKLGTVGVMCREWHI